MNIALAVEEAAGLKVLKSVIDSPDTVVALLTSSERRSSAPLLAYAEKTGVRIWPAEKVTQPGFAETLRQLGTDLLLNVHSLHVIRAEVASAPSIGSFNLHPGPLPEYAGLNAPSWAVFNGESRHAVTLHWIAGDIDAGPIAYEAWFDIGPQDTGLSVSAACVTHGIPLIEELLNVARQGAVPSRPQDMSRRHVYLRRDIPYNGRVPWTSSAREIVRLIRACDYYPLPSPWGYAWTMHGDSRTEIVKARLSEQPSQEPPGKVINAEGGEARIASGNEAVIVERALVDSHQVRPADVFTVGTTVC